MRAWTLGLAVLLGGCDTSLGGFRFGCGPDAGCPTGQSCQAGFCAAPGGSGSSGGGNGAGSSGSASSGSGSTGGGGGWTGGNATSCDTTQGRYKTLPSLGTDRPMAVAVDGQGNLLVVAEPSNNIPELFALAPDGGLSVIVSSITQMGVPVGLAVDAQGDVFLLDDASDLFEVTKGTSTATSLCTSACFSSGSRALTVAPDGTIYVALGTCVKSLTGGAPATVAGTCNANPGFLNATGSAAQFESLQGIAITPDGSTLIVTDGANNYYCLRQIDLATAAVTDFADVPCQSQPFYSTTSFGVPFGVAVDGTGNVFVTNPGPQANNLWEVTPGGEFRWLAGGGTSAADAGSACGADFGRPTGVALDAADDVFILDQDNSHLYELTP